LCIKLENTNFINDPQSLVNKNKFSNDVNYVTSKDLKLKIINFSILSYEKCILIT